MVQKFNNEIKKKNDGNGSKVSGATSKELERRIILRTDHTLRLDFERLDSLMQ